MKKSFPILLAAMLMLIVNFQAEANDPPITQQPNTELNKVDTIGTIKEIDGKQFVVVANEIDKSTGMVVAIVKEYKANQESGSLLQFLITIIASGTLGTVFTQFTKTSKMVLSFVNSIDRPVRVAFYIAGAIAAAWMGFDTNFSYSGFTFIAFATKWLLVFGPTLLVYEFVVRFILERFKRTKTLATA